MDVNQRLERIEEKLDDMSQLLAKLGVIEERASGIVTRVQRHEYRLDVIEDIQRDQSNKLASHVGKGAIFERAAWIVLAAVLSLGAKFF